MATIAFGPPSIVYVIAFWTAPIFRAGYIVTMVVVLGVARFSTFFAFVSKIKVGESALRTGPLIVNYFLIPVPAISWGSRSGPRTTALPSFALDSPLLSPSVLDRGHTAAINKLHNRLQGW